MKTRIIIIFWILILPVICLATELPNQVKTSDGFIINLSKEWRQIPKDVLETYSEKLVKLAPKAPKQLFNYGFQLSNSKKWFEFPYIIIQVKNNHRFSESSLKSIKQVEKSFNSGIKNAQNALPNYLSNVKIGETVYDPNLHILWTEIGMNTKNNGQVKGLLAALLTELGTITIVGYSKAEDFEKYHDVFQAIAINTIIDNKIKYKPRITDSIPFLSRIDWIEIIRNPIIWIILTGLLVFIIRFIKHKNSVGGFRE